MLRKLRLILWKNLLIRRRHWILTITEILMPILLFSLIAYGRSKISGMNKIEIKDAAYQEPLNVIDIDAHFPIEELQLWYSPYTDFAENIIRKVQEKLQIPGEAIKDFRSEEELLKHFTKNTTTFIVAIIFKENELGKLNCDISIHDKYLMWDTDKLFVPMINMEESGSLKYIYKGFAALQIAISTAFMEIFAGKNDPNINFVIQEFPYPPYTLDSGLNQLFIQFLPLVTIFSFVFLCPAVLKRVGEEKYSGTKEFLKMVGMDSWMLWLGWFIHALVSNVVSIIAIVILMKVPFWGVPYPPIEHSDGVILFAFLTLYCIAAISFCFLIATIFNSPSIATVIGILIWIFSYFIPQTIINSKEGMRWGYKILCAVFPNMALYYGYSAIGVYEMREVGIKWYNIFQSGSNGENDITMGSVFLSLFFDTVIFMSLTFYLENVKPGKYGIAKSFNFPLLNLLNWIKNIFSPSQVESSIELLERCQERVPCIQIINLHKNFYKNVAVDNLTMDIYENNITVLLGHNGAGKTTTMSILTGMINATKGSVIINGKNIKKHTNEVRKKLGLCPQHNLLFPDLTAMEHLQFFAMLKGKSGDEAKQEAKYMLQTFKIDENAMACTLSGGMKRKLCLGMALVGDSKVLILDEPTSGMDPESRREIWNMLLEHKKSKTILITTHFMEEADVLGDWIAIMANGKLQCYDTPISLKNKYNTGYHLSLMLNSTESSIEKITTEIKRKIPEAYLLRQNGENVVYLLPLDKKSLYANLFNTLDTEKCSLGIVTVGLSITTLSDVFLKARDEIDGQNVDAMGMYNEETEKLPKLEGTRRNFGIFFSLILKRCYFLKRKFYWYIPAILVTICIFLVTMCLGMANINHYNYGGPRLNLSLSTYGKTGVLYGGTDDFSSSYVTKMKKYYHQAVLEEKGDPFLVEDVSQGIIQKGIENIAYYKKHMIVAAEFNASRNNKEIIVNAMYSKSALHSLPISINLAMNAVLKSLFNESFSITVANVPLTPLYSNYSPSELSEISVGILWLVLVPTSMLFFMSNFIIFPNSEVSTHFMQIQTMAGVKTYVYWLINIIFDTLLCILKLFVLFLTLILVDVMAFDSKSFGAPELRVLIAIFLCYCFTSLPFIYLFSCRKTISGGFTLLIMFGMFSGITPTLIVRALELSEDSYYMQIGNYLKHVFLWTFPQFSLSYICEKFSQKYVQNFNWLYMNPNKKKFICDTEPNPCCYGDDTWECYHYKDYFKNEKLGVSNNILEMIMSFFIYFIILCFLNSELYKKTLHYIKYWQYYLCCNKINNGKGSLVGIKNEDYYDKNEEGQLCAKNLCKSFGNKTIVNNLKLILKKQKCFGLLGVNGAGKSTTFRMLTKDTFCDKGEITMAVSNETTNLHASELQPTMKSITIEEPEYSEKIGYCPQEDYLNYFLTGRELLRVVALIRGYSIQHSVKVAEYLLNLFDLTTYADKPTLEYSGGNKRKLSSCIAFLGFPKVILLDEPTSGVDPASRRNFWNILSLYKKNKDASFLLCSHSMEECEALCDEIGIMKDGAIKDQGTLPFLKNKHQKGYTIEIKLKNTTEAITNKIEQKINSKVKTTLKDKYKDLLKYHVEDTNTTLSKLFNMMEQLKLEYENSIDDYVINQISLEEIFLSVAKEGT